MGRLLGGAGPTRPTDAARLMDLPAPLVTYSGRWYLPMGMPGPAGAPGNGTLHLIPVVIRDQCSITGLAVRLTTGGTLTTLHCQFAIYASSTANRPNGAPLYTSATTTTMTAGIISPAAFSLALQPGLYWLAVNFDNTTNVCVSVAIASQEFGQVVGVSTAALLSLAVSSVAVALTIAQTYGTMPTFTTSTAFTESGTALNPLIMFQAAST